ncbi:MAG TPA: DNA alkylation repair protein [Steroidobacteraceae bacterium]
MANLPARSKTFAKPRERRARDVRSILKELERHGSARFRADMPVRYGIVTKDRVIGVSMARLKLTARKLGRDHALAARLWASGVYEGRMLASMVAEPERLTAAQMDRWAHDFDNWAVVDTMCFNLFDRSPHAFAKVTKWAKSKDEFVKRAAFALLACLALHRRASEEDLLRALPLLECAATDDRNFVKKAVSWALRAIGTKAGPKARTAARELANRLAASDQPSARWIGKDARRVQTSNPPNKIDAISNATPRLNTVAAPNTTTGRQPSASSFVIRNSKPMLTNARMRK